MKRTISSLLMAVVLPLGAAVAVTAPATDAQAQYYVPPPPPPGYYARYRPVYVDGRAHYYYNGYWYYRDGYGNWRYYDREPAWGCTYRNVYGQLYRGRC